VPDRAFVKRPGASRSLRRYCARLREAQRILAADIRVLRLRSGPFRPEIVDLAAHAGRELEMLVEARRRETSPRR